MKKILYSIAILAISSSVVLSCKKTSINDADNNIDNSTPLAIDNYLPSAEGSWWLYNSTLGDQFKRVATGKDSLRDGLIFKYFINTNQRTMDDEPEYFGKFDENKYFSLITFESSDDPNYIRLNVMKDNPKVGDKWVNVGESHFEGFGKIDFEINCEILSTTDEVETIDKKFNNVVKMRAKMKGKAAITSWLDCGSVTYYFVEGVGVVKQDFNIKIDVAGIVLYQKNHIDELREFYIAK